MANFVKSVEYVEITLTGSTAVSANLTKSQTIADCVPFHTVNLNSTVSAPVANRHVEVYFEAGPKVTAIRDGSTGTVVVGVFVVEFDTSGDITVQQGTYSFADTGDTQAITAVTLVKAFVLTSYRCTSTSNNYHRAQVKAKFNSTTELAFDRINGTSAGTVTGRYFVVATAGTDFSVIHDTVSMGSTDETTESTISAITLASSFLAPTHDSSEGSNDTFNAGVVTDLKNTTTIRSRRAFLDFGDETADATADTAAVVEAQVISAGGSEFTVERAECDWGVDVANAVAVTEIDQAKAIVAAGGHMGMMSSDQEFDSGVPPAFATMKFTSDTEMTGTRGDNAGNDGTTMFEVVEFALVAAAIEQEGFRWRNDDDNEADATWRQNQDVDDSIGKDANIRLRALINATGDPGGEQYQVEYKESADPDSAYRKVPL